MTTNAICVYDWTVSADKVSKDDVMSELKRIAKSWAFQLEEGSKTGYKHYQCRFSLKIKKRLNELQKMLTIKEGHLSATSEENKDNNFYVIKSTTKIDGPWTDQDKEIYIPRQIREVIKLYDWQEKVLNDRLVWNTRNINIIYDPIGNHGKSILKTYIGVHGYGRAIPFSNDFKDIMRMVMDTEKKPLYIIDVPRALKKEHLFQFFSGVETLKDGYAYDDRYSFKEEYFDCPNIWIFMNTIPDMSYLSKDRWIFWKFDDEFDRIIEQFNPEEIIKPQPKGTRRNFKAVAEATCNSEVPPPS